MSVYYVPVPDIYNQLLLLLLNNNNIILPSDNYLWIIFNKFNYEIFTKLVDCGYPNNYELDDQSPMNDFCRNVSFNEYFVFSENKMQKVTYLLDKLKDKLSDKSKAKIREYFNPIYPELSSIID